MKIVVIGGSGLIGSKTVARLRRQGHEVLAASPASGVNSVTGEGLGDALRGASVVVDVANSPSFADADALAFFAASARNLLAAGKDAGVRHHVALSVVGTERLLESGYFRAKQAQEDLVRAAGLPYTLVRATQFFEFLDGIASWAAADGTLRLPPVAIRPVASDDVAATVAAAALGVPADRTIEVAGPGAFRLDALLRDYLAARRDRRRVVGDTDARYFGAHVDDTSLVPAGMFAVGEVSLADWLARTAVAA